MFYVIIASLRLWMKPKLVGLYLIVAPFLLGGAAQVRWENIVRFLTEDIVPAPLRNADLLDPQAWSAFGDWLAMLLTDQALPGVIATVVLTQIALVATAFLTLAFFPLISTKFFGRLGRGIGHLFLVIMRSTPEFILVYIFLHKGWFFVPGTNSFTHLSGFQITAYRHHFRVQCRRRFWTGTQVCRL